MQCHPASSNIHIIYFDTQWSICKRNQQSNKEWVCWVLEQWGMPIFAYLKQCLSCDNVLMILHFVGYWGGRRAYEATCMVSWETCLASKFLSYAAAEKSNTRKVVHQLIFECISVSLNFQMETFLYTLRQALRSQIKRKEKYWYTHAYIQQ